MTINKPEKEKLIKDYRINDQDTGSVQLQVALLTDRIKRLTEHLQDNAKDFSSKRGLLHMVSKRRRFLKYLERSDENQYKKLIKSLGLRK